MKRSHAFYAPAVALLASGSAVLVACIGPEPQVIPDDAGTRDGTVPDTGKPPPGDGGSGDSAADHHEPFDASDGAAEAGHDSGDDDAGDSGKEKDSGKDKDADKCDEDAGSGAVGVVGCPCKGKELGCAGNASKELLACLGSAWSSNGSCSSSDRCDTREDAGTVGTCLPTDGCDTAGAGAEICTSAGKHGTQMLCDIDLLPTDPVACPFACVTTKKTAGCSGVCVPGDEACGSSGSDYYYYNQPVKCDSDGQWKANGAPCEAPFYYCESYTSNDASCAAGYYYVPRDATAHTYVVEASRSVSFVWHDTKGYAAPVDLWVEAGERPVLQISAERGEAFARVGLDVAPLEANFPYRLVLERRAAGWEVSILRTVTSTVPSRGSSEEVVVSAEVTEVGALTLGVPADGYRVSLVTDPL